MKKIFKKITIIIVGFIVIVLFLEISLRVLGYIHLKQREDTRDIGDGEYVILCLGDSYTEGLGAPIGEGYPEQLERLFDLRYGEGKVKVINKGVSSYGTAMLLENLEENLDEINPDIIILLIGWTNYWNFYGYREYLSGRTFLSRLKNLLYRIRIYKLVRLIFFNIEQKEHRANFINENIYNNQSMKAIDIYSKDSEKENKYYRDFCEFKQLAFFYKDHGEYDKSIYFFEKALEKTPEDMTLRSELIHKYFKDFRTYHYKENKLGSVIIEGIKLNPESFLFLQFFVGLCRYDKHFCIDNLDILSKIEHKNPAAGDVFKAMQKEATEVKIKVRDWIIYDIEKIIKKCNERGIKIVFHNYPIIYIQPYFRLVNAILKRIARKHSIPFINHNAVFGYMQSQGINIRDYFVPDLHCNEKGYRIMAENIYNKIIEERLIDID